MHICPATSAKVSHKYQTNNRNDRYMIGNHCELLAKCKDASIASACMEVMYRVRRDTQRFNPTDFLLSKAVSKTWVYLDGNHNQILNIPFDDPSVVANAWGIMTKPFYEEKVRLGVFEGRKFQAVHPPAAAAAASVSISLRFVSLSTTLHYSNFLTLSIRQMAMIPMMNLMMYVYQMRWWKRGQSEAVRHSAWAWSSVRSRGESQ